MREKVTVMKKLSIGQMNKFGTFTDESLFICDFAWHNSSYVQIPLVESQNAKWAGGLLSSSSSERPVVRRGVTGSVPTEPVAGSRLILLGRVAIAAVAIAVLASGCSGAVAASKTTKPPVKSKAKAKAKPAVKKKVTVAPTAALRSTTTTKLSVLPTTLVPKLSAEAEAVLAGYESYLTVFVAAAREPEKAETILPAGVTGDALSRLNEIARYDLSKGQFWDGKRTDIIAKPRVQSLGETRATIRDCQSVGGVLRKRATNEVVNASVEPDIDDLVVDLVKVDGRWVVTRTDRTNPIEGRSPCGASSP
jgi:hypothetical protein